jgi:hypothetical protein
VDEATSVSHQESEATLTIIVDDITEQCDINSHQMGNHRVHLVDDPQLVNQSEDLPKASSYTIQMVLSDDQQPIATDIDSCNMQKRCNNNNKSDNHHQSLSIDSVSQQFYKGDGPRRYRTSFSSSSMYHSPSSDPSLDIRHYGTQRVVIKKAHIPNTSCSLHQYGSILDLSTH